MFCMVLHQLSGHRILSGFYGSEYGPLHCIHPETLVTRFYNVSSRILIWLLVCNGMCKICRCYKRNPLCAWWSWQLSTTHLKRVIKRCYIMKLPSRIQHTFILPRMQKYRASCNGQAKARSASCLWAWLLASEGAPKAQGRGSWINVAMIHAVPCFFVKATRRHLDLQRR